MKSESPDHGSGGRWTPADIAGMVANPYYAIQIHPGLTQPHETIISEDTWVGANARLIEELGPIAYLRNLLMILKGEVVVQGTAIDGDSRPSSIDDADAYDEPDDDGHDHALIDADAADGYVTEQIVSRLETEPGLIARAIAAFEAVDDLDDEVADEVEELESDSEILRDALRASRQTWDDLDPGAHRLLVHYLIDHIMVGSPELPIDKQITIHWRLPRPDRPEPTATTAKQE